MKRNIRTQRHIIEFVSLSLKRINPHPFMFDMKKNTLLENNSVMDRVLDVFLLHNELRE